MGEQEQVISNLPQEDDEFLEIMGPYDIPEPPEVPPAPSESAPVESDDLIDLDDPEMVILQSQTDIAALFDWITAKEAAKLSGYNVEYIRRLIRMGRIVAVKKGLMWWINRHNFEAFVQAQKSSADPRSGPKTGS